MAASAIEDMTIAGAPASSSAVVVAERTFYEVLRDAEADREIVTHSPVGIAQTRAALKNLRGEPNDALRRVLITWDSVPAKGNDDNIEVHGPKDGRPLIVIVHSGFPGLVVTSGTVFIVAGAAVGNRINVRSGATATILAGASCKVSTDIDAGAVVDFYAEPGARGYQSIQEGTLFTFHGERENIRLSTDPGNYPFTRA